MNQHLESILHFIEQSNFITAEEKRSYSKKIQDADKELQLTAFKLDRTEKVKRTTSILLEETIEELEHKRKAVEEKNRELEIESALERVRASAMAMHHSAELSQVLSVLFDQFDILGICPVYSQMSLINLDTNSFKFRCTGKLGKRVMAEQTLSLDSSYIWQESADRWKNSEPKSISELFFPKEVIPQIFELFNEVRAATPAGALPLAEDFPNGIYVTEGNCQFGYMGFAHSRKASVEEKDIVMKFATEFGRIYQRFLDLQKSEAQAKEAQIQLGLERVRARAMAMQNSDELNALIGTVFIELTRLDLHFTRCLIMIIDPETNGSRWWMANSEAPETPMNFFVQFHENPPYLAYIKGWRQRKLQWEYIIDGTIKKEWDDFIFSQTELSQLPNFVIVGMRSPERVYLNASFNNFGNLTLATLEPLSNEHSEILLRFAKVFDLTYTRFNDLKQAEAQAKESQIETALERVRSRSMGMQKSEELKEVINIVCRQLSHLKINLDHAGFVVDYTPGGDWHFWIADEQDIPSKISHPYFESVWANQFNDAKEKNADFFATHLNYEEKNRFYNELLSYVPGIPEASKKFYLSCPGLAASTVLLEHIALYIENFSGIPFTEEENTTLMRFGKVFQQAYTRFLDLQKAEAQAREAQIEAALERVRSGTMAMQKSSELGSVATKLFDQMNLLVPDLWTCGFVLCDSNKTNDEWWLSGGNGYFPDLILPHTGDALHEHMYEGWLAGKTYYAEIITGEALEQHYQWLMTIPSANVAFDIQAAAEIKRPVWQQLSCAYFSQGFLCVITAQPCHEEQVFKRFAQVFDQTYTRFLDLQNAEAQARESKIQLALERVRARTMAMQHSAELQDAALLLFQQVETLGLPPFSCGFNIWDEDSKFATAWMGGVPGLQPPFKTDSSQDIYLPIYKAAQNGESMLVIEQRGKELEAHYQYLATIPTFREVIIPNLEKLGHSLPTFQIIHCAFFSKGYLMFISYEAVPAFYEIFKRFAKVFEQTYTRFLDLQKAEAQAKEAKIEASLERIRSRTMAMQKSDELTDVAGLLFEQVNNLGIKTWTAGFNVWSDDNNAYVDYITSPSGGFIEPYTVHTERCEALTDISNARKSGVEFDVLYVEGEKIKQLYLALTKLDEKQYEIMLQDGVRFPSHQYEHFVFGSKVSLMFITYEPAPEAHDIFKRFGKVFEQTYTRFLDLQKAEAQARESQIEAALERVRSRTLAMQKSKELAETAAVLFQQLILLGIEPNRLYITIIKDAAANAEFWITDEDGTKVSAAFETNMNSNATFKKMHDGWKEKNKALVIDMSGVELKQYFEYLTSIHVPFKGGLTQKRRLQYIAYFNKGFIGMASPDEQPQETIFLLERFAAVFNLTFTRFNDLQVAEAHAKQAAEDLVKLQTEKKRAEDALNELQATQKQLIQAEKMASLGELTAGIAHEIQNPLNFVNNFSDLNNELIVELKIEIENKNFEEVIAIADDIQKNEIKINHHGKRADAIVKGMLQHSRSNSGEKQSTDINKLADEYLRLSYHGLRAKDKSFNATIETNFDQSISTIYIISQDIGRVLLNLINNAFYAVDEKKKQAGENYEPTVSIHTKKMSNLVEIAVIDNGNGIPKKIADKIFNPFFTTKPTGEGTGLGLSLSYDIIKAHGGEIKVETKEGEGSTFFILLAIH